MNEKSKNPELGLYATKSGKGFGIRLNAKNYDLLQKAELDGYLLLTPVSEETKEKAEANGKNAPDFRLTFLPKTTNTFNKFASKPRTPSRAKVDL